MFREKVMKIHEEKKGKATVFALVGRLDSSTSQDVEQQITGAIQGGTKDVVLDFTSLEYISSAGIRVLVHCHKEIEKQGGHIYLASVPKPIENVLYITGFLPYFTLFEKPNEAVDALNQEEGH